MTLATGLRLGPYEILSALGAGGMGEVYRARDTRLDRTVAIKVLPTSVANDADLRQRFDREAKAISSLSHPNICTLHDVGHQDGIDYLVMEYIDGESLQERLKKGPMPIAQALRHAVEIADALDKAHRHGITHRDLKPANVMLTKSGAKLLDFGLAKLTVPDSTGGLSALATAERPLTGAGTLLGTFQYMAPEQLEGKEADARADVFAFGAVLYEMVTGRKAFEGKSQASLIAAIMGSEPAPLSAIARLAPPALERVVRSCLAKDPDDRWQSAHDVAAELRWISEGGSQAGSQVGSPAAVVAVMARRKKREWLAWAIAAAAVLVATGLALVRARPVPAISQAVLRTNILLPEKVALNTVAISPDGSRVVFSGTDATGKVQLWVRSLDAYASVALAGTEGGVLPFWSPDGRNVGFFSDKKLKRVDIAGGVPMTLYDVDGGGGAWAPNGDILFCALTGPVHRLPARGGKAEPVTTLDTSRQETAHRYPFFLPDGRHFLYLALNVAGNSRDPANRIWAGSTDGGPARPLIPANFGAQYADGYLLFIRGGDLGGSLLAQPFDPARLETSGDPVTVADQISLYREYLGLGNYAVARSGTLVFDAFRLQTRLEWFDRAGKQTGFFGDPAPHFNARISPDGTHVAFDLYDTGTQTTQVWVGDVARGVQTRLTSGPSSNSTPIWSPDGSRVAFQSDRKHQADVYVRPRDGSGADEAITDADRQTIPTDWSPDGRFMTLFDREGGGSRRIQVSAIPLLGDRKPFLVVPPLPGILGDARLSPDGHFLAYDTDESGRGEIYVTSFPEGKGRVQISNAGGALAKWARGGREILYTAFDGKVTSVEIDTSRGLRVGAPKPLFPLPEGTSPFWDVSGNGERFLLNVPVIKSSSIPLSLVVNWTAGLRK
jgi:eukaryotic-like serine/threonine-protein kinase